MDERFFKSKLRKHLQPHCYIQSMSSLATNGTPDLWISGNHDLWAEIKCSESIKGPIKPKLSPLQKLWLDGRYAEGRNVMVICGTSPKEGIIYRNGEWGTHSNDRITFDQIIKEILACVA